MAVQTYKPLDLGLGLYKFAVKVRLGSDPSFAIAVASNCIRVGYAALHLTAADMTAQQYNLTLPAHE